MLKGVISVRPVYSLYSRSIRLLAVGFVRPKILFLAIMLLLLSSYIPVWGQWRWPVDGFCTWTNDFASFNRAANKEGIHNRMYHTGIDILPVVSATGARQENRTIYPAAPGVIRRGYVHGLAPRFGGIQTFWVWNDRNQNRRWDEGEEVSHTAGWGDNHGLGITIIIEHSGGVYSLYGHLRCISKAVYETVIQKQQPYQVDTNTPIGIMGGSVYNDRNGTSPHLHFEIKTHDGLGDTSDIFWGYVPDLPRTYGYYDPATWIEGFPQVEALQPRQAVTVLGDVVNVRSGPGKKYAVIAKITEGQQFVARRIARVSASEEWVEIYLPNERGIAYGWAARRWGGTDFLRFDPNARIVRVIWNKVELRDGPGIHQNALQVWDNVRGVGKEVWAWRDSYFVSTETRMGSGSTKAWHKICIHHMYWRDIVEDKNSDFRSGRIQDRPVDSDKDRIGFSGGIVARQAPSSWKRLGDWGGYAWIPGDALEEVSSGVNILMDVSQTSLSFGSVEVGNRRDVQLVITNQSGSTANLTGSVNISGADFSILEGTGSFSLAPNSSRVYTIRFTPTGASARTGTLRITHNATNRSSPLDIGLSGTGIDTVAPNISNVRIEPTTLSNSGGTVAIRADATDGAGVSSVWAEVKKPDGSTVTVPMSKESGNTFKGDYSASANTSSSEQRYTVRVSARDPSNNVASTGWDYSFSVRGAAVYMDLSTTSLDFGSVNVGSFRDLSITLTNRSTSAATLTGDITITGADFSVVSGGGSFSLAPGSSRAVNIRFSPTDAVSRSGTLQIRHNATNQSNPILVNLTGVGAAPKIRVEPETLAFSTIAGSNPAVQSFTIRNIGTTTLNWRASKVGGAGWFSFSPASGSLSPNSSQSVTVSINAAGLGQGTYTDSIQVTDPNAINSPQRVQIALTVTAVARPTIDVIPTSLVFTTTLGTNPGNQTFTIRNTGAATLAWNATKQGGSGWLSFTPSSGTISAGSSQLVTVSINAAGLGLGTYNDSIVISDPNATNSSRRVSVTLNVTSTRHYIVLNAENASGQVGQEVTLRAALRRSTDGTPVVGRNVHFTVDGQSAGSAVTDGQGVASLRWTVTDGNLGYRPLVAHFSGDSEYEPASGSATFRRYAETVLRTDDVEAYQREVVTIGATLHRRDTQGDWQPIQGRTLRFYINGTYIGDSETDQWGLALIEYRVPIDASSGIISVSFEGDEFYAPSYAEGRLIVHPWVVGTVVVVDNVEAYRGDTVTLRAVVLRADTWSPLTGVLVHFAVDGEYIGYATAGPWGAEISYEVRPDMELGEHIIEAFFGGEDVFHPSFGQGLLRVREKRETFIEVFNSWGKQGEIVPVGARLLSANGTPVEGAWLDFFIDGELIGGGPTNSEGYVIGRYGIPPNAVPGEHPIEVFFDGNEVLSASRGSGILYVDPVQTRIFGYVELGDFVGDTTTVPVRVEIRPLGSNVPVEVHDTFLDANSVFHIETWKTGEFFDIAVKASHWLRQRLTYAWLWKEVWIPFSLTNGDIDGDNEVSLLDLGQLVAAFGSVPGAGNWNANADLDGDNEVTMLDFGIIVRNFGLVGDE